MTDRDDVTGDEQVTEDPGTGAQVAGDQHSGETDAVDLGKPTAKATPDEPVAEPDPLPEDVGEILFYEPGGSWWVVTIGPALLALTLWLEIAGGGRIHWEVLTIFGVVLIGFSVLQVVAARRHVSVLLTEQTLQQGTKTIALADIARIYPENRGDEFQEWESAPALGELHAVPRRRKGVGVKLRDGKLAQAWARDVDRFRVELSEAHLAVTMGLGPKGSSNTGG